MHQGHSPTTAGKARREIKKRCKSGIYVDSIQLEDLLRVTHLPSGQAARTLGLGITVRGHCGDCVMAAADLHNRLANWPILSRLQVFKKICRLRGLERWPYQKPCEVRRVVTSIATSYSRHDTFDRRVA